MNLTDQMLDESKIAIGTVFDTLVVNAETMQRISEQAFVTYFLPYFVNEKSFDDGHNMLEKWVAFAGSPMVEVSVVDTNNKELFRVPSMYDSNVINAVGKVDAVSVGAICEHAKMLSRNIPIQGARYLEQAIDNKTSQLIQPEEDANTNEAKWIAIFQRYGKMKSPEVVALEVKEDMEHQDIIDDLDYGD